MKIFVVLATREREELLARTLASLAQCRRPEGFRGTLVVENGLRGGAERVVREAAATLEARYLFESVGNKSLALNAAMGRESTRASSCSSTTMSGWFRICSSCTRQQHVGQDQGNSSADL